MIFTHLTEVNSLTVLRILVSNLFFQQFRMYKQATTISNVLLICDFPLTPNFITLNN